MHNVNIKITDDGKVEVKTSGLNYEQFLQVVLTAIEGAAAQLIEDVAAHEEKVEGITKQCRDALFDITNMAFSSTLERIDPEGELHPTLTTQAILEAENKIINEGRLNEVKEGS